MAAFPNSERRRDPLKTSLRKLLTSVIGLTIIRAVEIGDEGSSPAGAPSYGHPRRSRLRPAIFAPPRPPHILPRSDKDFPIRPISSCHLLRFVVSCLLQVVEGPVGARAGDRARDQGGASRRGHGPFNNPRASPNSSRDAFEALILSGPP